MTPKDTIRRIFVSDTTLRDGEQSPGCSMTAKEKMEVGRQLARLGVAVIEAGFPISSNGDFDSVKAIAEVVGNMALAGYEPPTIAGLARAKESDIRRAGEAVRAAKYPRIHTFLSTSKLHMERKLRLTPAATLAMAVDAVKLAKSLVEDVEFSLEDGGRTEWPFMLEVVAAVIEAGATTVNIPDTVGYCQPEEIFARFKHVVDNVPSARGIILSAHCHDDLGLAVANSLAAVRAGARQVECTINGIGERAGNASLEEVVMNLKTRGPYFEMETRINPEQLCATSRLVSQVTSSRVQANKAIVGANAFAHESGIHQDGMLKDKGTYEIMTPESVGWKGEGMVMGKHSGRHAFGKRLTELGFELAPEEMQRAFDKLKELADKKKEVLDDDIVAIASDIVFKEGADSWKLTHMQVTSGTDTIPTATVRMTFGSEVITDAAFGDGPVDAVMKAIERIADVDLHVHEYRLDAVTEGQDAQGIVTLTVSRESAQSTKVKGRGVSTDIVMASALAFVNALNALDRLERMQQADPRPKIVTNSP